ncbi:MAG: 50S ribosomal protein L25 [Candidatus Berkelbacteria bacterium]|nr:50S ribosomal protein L25 [Candidatus Berkelbacteria bacterium]
MTEQKKYNLGATKRTVIGKSVKNLRKDGKVPAVVYGHSMKPESLEVDQKIFDKIFSEAGSSSLVDLAIDSQSPTKVLIHEPQLNPVSGEAIHIDFYKVRMDEKIKTEIPLEFIGESEAVTALDGSLVTNRDNIEVECLPTDLVPNFEVDLSRLKTFDDSITVADISVPSSIEVLTDPEELVASVEAPRSDEELAELEESAAEEEKEAIEQIAGEEGGEVAEGEEGAEAKEGAEGAGQEKPAEQAPEEKKEK